MWLSSIQGYLHLMYVGCLVACSGCMLNLLEQYFGIILKEYIALVICVNLKKYQKGKLCQMQF